MDHVMDTPDGDVSGSLYVIDYNEDLWLDNTVHNEFVMQQWIKKATPLGVKYVVLRLHPDPLFPMYGNEKPYIYWQHEIVREPECGFSITAEVTVTVADSIKLIEPVMRSNITKALYTTLKGTFRIVNKNGNVLEHGKL